MKTAEEKERLFKIFRANAQRSVIGVAIEEDDFDDLADAIIEEYANQQSEVEIKLKEFVDEIADSSWLDATGETAKYWIDEAKKLLKSKKH